MIELCTKNAITSCISTVTLYNSRPLAPYICTQGMVSAAATLLLGWSPKQRLIDVAGVLETKNKIPIGNHWFIRTSFRPKNKRE